MPRQPITGAGAAVRSPSGAATHAPAPSYPLSPQRYRALRARYNALLVTLYERSTLTLLEIATIAGRTDRAVQMLVRALGCRPRNAKTCRPGTNVGPRRPGPRPPPLNAPAVRRAAEAFASVARELAASPQRRAASEAQRAVACAERRTARTQARTIAGAARSLRHLAAAMESAAAARHALTAGSGGKAGRSRAPKMANRTAKQHSREEARLAQERLLRAGTEQMYEAHRARDLAARDLAARQSRAEAAPTSSPESDLDRRINAIAERYYNERR